MRGLIAICWLFGCGAPEDPGTEDPPPERTAPDARGPWGVGVTTLVLEGEPPLTVEVWYPAVDPGEDPEPYPELPLPSTAWRDADPDRSGAPYPVVAFSHGFGGIRYQSAFLTEHLASHGFVVVAPDHPHQTLLDLDPSLAGEVLVERPGQVSRAVDGLLAEPSLAGMAEEDRFLMSGHSFGGMTTLLVGGGVLDVAGAQARCAEGDYAGCAFFEDAPIGDPSRVQADPRAVALVDISPGGWYAFAAGGLDGLPPSLAIGGSADEDLPYVEEARPTMEALPRPKVLSTLAGAGHWAVTDLCSLITVLVDCQGAAGGFMEPARVREVVRTQVAAFAGVQLTGDPVYDGYLEPDAWAEDVTVEVFP